MNMFGLKNNQENENIKNIPSDDSYPMIPILFSKNNGIGVNSLSLTILDLINKDQIKCDIDLDNSYEVRTGNIYFFHILIFGAILKK